MVNRTRKQGEEAAEGRREGDQVVMSNIPNLSSSTHSWTYDVFLNFRPADTRHTFVEHLYSDLIQRGIITFVDDGLRRDEEISSPHFIQSIERSRISVIVFSENYASSEWCLEQLVKILECKESKQQIVVPIFYKVSPLVVRRQNGSYGEAFANHERRFEYDMAKVLRWRRALVKAANLAWWSLTAGNESQFLHDIVEEISVQLSRIYLKENRGPKEIEDIVITMPQPEPDARSFSKVTLVEYTFLLSAFFLEILSLACDQASSPSKPQYALYGMLLAYMALLTCIWELIYKGRRERVELARWGMFWWFYHPRPLRRPFGTLADIYGLVGGISQCIFSTIQYVCIIRHVDNPIKVSLWPAIFLICLGAKRLYESPNKLDDEHTD